MVKATTNLSISLTSGNYNEYGLYYQTPIYEFIYRNISKLEDPAQAFEDAGTENQSIGNATMTAGKTQAYELAFNIQLNRHWAVSAGVWVKDMNQLTTASDYSTGVYEYKVAKNGDFGTAIGYDLTLTLRGEYLHSTIQYTYSTAKASSEYEEKAFGVTRPHISSGCRRKRTKKLRRSYSVREVLINIFDYF